MKIKWTISFELSLLKKLISPKVPTKFRNLLFTKIIPMLEKVPDKSHGNTIMKI